MRKFAEVVKIGQIEAGRDFWYVAVLFFIGRPYKYNIQASCKKETLSLIKVNRCFFANLYDPKYELKSLFMMVLSASNKSL